MGDGYPGVLDCDPASEDHWADCGSCVDGDGDGYGLDCDLGVDCDDGAAGTHPGAADPFGDGIDTDCDGFDGSGLFDGFELGEPDPAVWSDVTGTWGVVTTQAATGTFSLRLDGTAVAQSQTIDTSLCPEIVWSYAAKRGPSVPEVGDDLVLSYDDGTSWVTADVLEGQGIGDADFALRFGTLSDPGAYWSGLRIQLENTSAFPFDEFHVDDVTLACSDVDGDGDGVPPLLDCDDADPAHWFDCGVCIDGDGDGYGLDCDLGDDCDDLDPALNPGAADPAGDGIDADCSGVDGPGLFDDFELGMPAPGVWASMVGTYAYNTTHAHGGTTSLQLSDTTTATSRPWDASSCATVIWSYQGKRGPDAPESIDALTLSWFDGLDWIEADALFGDGTVDAAFGPRAGTIVDPLAIRADLQIRLAVAGLDFFGRLLRRRSVRGVRPGGWRRRRRRRCGGLRRCRSGPLERLRRLRRSRRRRPRGGLRSGGRTATTATPRCTRGPPTCSGTASTPIVRGSTGSGSSTTSSWGCPRPGGP